MTVSESQARANKKYDLKNPEQARHRKGLSSSRSFIRNQATKEDLDELRELIDQKYLEL